MPGPRRGHYSLLAGLSGALLLFSLLTFLKAPIRALWIPAILVTEWGHLFAAISLVVFFLSWNSLSEPWRVPASALLAALLYLTPLLRARSVAAALPAALTQAFGPGASAQGAALSGRILATGFPSPAIAIRELTFTQAPGNPLRLDFYPASAPGPRPLVLVIHGGSWESGDKRDLPELNRYLAARGYAVASVNYRLAPHDRFPAPREDVFAAIRYLKSHASELGLDPSRIVLLGRSAGGQIALSAAYAGREAGIRGVIALYAPNDLVMAFRKPGNPLVINSRKLLSAYIGGTPDSNAAGYADASPLNAAGAASPPTLLIHGLRDELVWSLHSERLSAKLAAANRPHFFLMLPWATHGCDVNLSGPSGQLSLYTIERFLVAVL